MRERDKDMDNHQGQQRPTSVTKGQVSSASALRFPSRTPALLLCLTLAGCDPSTPTSNIIAPAAWVQDLATGPEWGPWSAPVNVAPVNSSVQENQPTLSPDELSLYFASPRPGGLGGNDIWVSRRASVASPWQTPVNLGASVNSPGNDQGPTLSIDGLLLFFHSDRPGGQGEMDIYMSRRTEKHDDLAWATAWSLGTDVNTSGYEAGPLYMQQVENGAINFYFARGPTPSDIDTYSVKIRRSGETRGPVIPVSEINFAVAGVTDAHATVRRDGKELIFFSNRPGGLGTEDLWVSTRQTVHEAWSPPVNLGPTLNAASREAQPSLSFDGTTLFFSSNRPGGLGLTDVYMSTRTLRPQ
jgi:hypothetical protein